MQALTRRFGKRVAMQTKYLCEVAFGTHYLLLLLDYFCNNNNYNNYYKLPLVLSTVERFTACVVGTQTIGSNQGPKQALELAQAFGLFFAGQN